MKKIMVLLGLLVVGMYGYVHADINSHRGAICVLDDDDDEMSDEELHALEQMPEVKHSAFEQWAARNASIVLGWYMSYRRYVGKIAKRVPFKKRRAQRA